MKKMQSGAGRLLALVLVLTMAFGMLCAPESALGEAADQHDAQWIRERFIGFTEVISQTLGLPARVEFDNRMCAQYSDVTPEEIDAVLEDLLTAIEMGIIELEDIDYNAESKTLKIWEIGEALAPLEIVLLGPALSAERYEALLESMSAMLGAFAQRSVNVVYQTAEARSEAVLGAEDATIRILLCSADEAAGWTQKGAVYIPVMELFGEAAFTMAEQLFGDIDPIALPAEEQERYGISIMEIPAELMDEEIAAQLRTLNVAMGRAEMLLLGTDEAYLGFDMSHSAAIREMFGSEDIGLYILSGREEAQYIYAMIYYLMIA